MGCSRAEIRVMSLRAFTLRLQAHRRSERAEWQRTLALVNTVGAIAGADPVSMDELQGQRRPQSSQQEYEALKGRHIEWCTTDTQDTTDTQ